jgi:hypothetical protein
MANKLCSLAEEDESAGRLFSAGEKYNLATTYYLTCEHLQAHAVPPGAKRFTSAVADLHLRRRSVREKLPTGGTRSDIVARRIAMEGVPLGDFCCPQAVAFEPCFDCDVV